MKHLVLLFPLLVTACASVALPNLVSDTVKAGKDIYRTVRPEKGQIQNNVLSNTAIGKDNQTVAEIKQQCITEALQKLDRVNPGYQVLENEISSVDQRVVAHCKLAIDPRS